MATALDRLTNLRVEQLMARDFITIHEDASLVDAARLMRNYGVTGLPVVDDFRRCVGVLSATDFVEAQSEAHSCCVQHVATSWDQSGLQRAETLSDDSVKAHMSPKVQSIREHRSIVDAGRLMCEEHIHRLVVIDRQGKPVGIISSLDLVSALVNAKNETNSN
jgi:CBS-domain-containing membrane protein